MEESIKRIRFDRGQRLTALKKQLRGIFELPKGFHPARLASPPNMRKIHSASMEERLRAIDRTSPMRTRSTLDLYPTCALQPEVGWTLELWRAIYYIPNPPQVHQHDIVQKDVILLVIPIMVHALDSLHSVSGASVSNSGLSCLPSASRTYLLACTAVAGLCMLSSFLTRTTH